MTYDAFISYSHAADNRLAPAVQSALHRFAKPFYKLRALHVFRDKTSLAATPELWGSIEKALASSRYFILLASPESATSVWVHQEIEYWLKHKGPEEFLIVATGGAISWDESACDFDWSSTTAIPRQLEKVFKQEPLYVDLGWAKQKEHLSLQDARYRGAITTLAAPLHGRPPDDLAGEDVKQNRRTKGVATLAVVLILAFAITAELQRRIASQERDTAISNYRVTQADNFRSRDPTVSMALALNALNLHESNIGKELVETLYHDNVFYDRVQYHLAPVQAIATSPTGEYFATGESKGRLRLWKRSGELIGSAKEHERGISSLAFSEDGKRLLTGDQDGVRLWEFDDKGVRLLDTHAANVISVAFLPKGGEVLSVSLRGDIYIWGGEGKPSRIRLKPRYGILAAAALTPDGEALFVGYGKNRVCLWSLSSEPVSTCQEFEGLVTAVDVSADGKYFLAASNNIEGDTSARVHVWDRDFQEIAILRGHEGTIKAALFSPNGETILTASLDKTLRLWALRGEQLQVIRGHEGVVLAADFFPTGDSFLSSSGHFSRGFSVLGIWGGREPTGKSPLTGLSDHSVRHWIVPSRLRKSLKLTGCDEHPVYSLSFSPDGSLFAAGQGDGTTYLYNRSGQQIKKMRGPGDAWITGSSYSAISFSNDSKKIAIDVGNIAVWDLSGRYSQRLTGCNTDVHSIAFSNDDTKLLVGGGSIQYGRNKACLWDMEGDLLHEFDDFDTPVTSVAFSPVDDLLAIMTYDNMVHLYDITGTQLHSFHTLEETVPIETQGPALKVRFAPDGNYLLTSAMDGSARMWDRNGNLINTYTGHGTPLADMALSRDGQYLLTGSRDARLWDIAGHHLQTFTSSEPGGIIHAVGFSDNGDVLLGFKTTSSPEKHIVNIWSLKPTVASFLENPPVAKLSMGHRLALDMVDDREVRRSTDPDELLDAAVYYKYHLETGRKIKHESILEAGLDAVVQQLSEIASWDNAGQFRHHKLLRGQAIKHWRKGDKEALEGHLGASIAEYHLAQQLAPILNIDPEERAYLKRARFFMKEARNAVVAGNLEAATVQFRRAVELDPSLKLEPQQAARGSMAQHARKQGEKEAAAGKLEAAINLFRKAIEINPSLKLNPVKEASRRAAPHFEKEAEKAASTGNPKLAMELFRHALTLDPTLKLDPQEKIDRLSVRYFRKEGIKAASTGNADLAYQLFYKALVLDPKLKQDPLKEAGREAARHIRKEGQKAADVGDRERALDLFHKAMKTDPELILDPEKEAAKYIARSKVKQIVLLVKRGEIAKALDAYDLAVRASVDENFKSRISNALCWNGSLYGFASDVMEVCNNAVKFSPDVGGYRDSRGLARALTGDIEGALSDVQAYLEWAPNHDRKQVDIQKRQQWFEVLSEGLNPIDSATLHELRCE